MSDKGYVMPMDDNEFRSYTQSQRDRMRSFSESTVTAAYSRLGLGVFHPMNGSMRAYYDLIVDNGMDIMRVHVATLSSQNQIRLGQRGPNDFDLLVAVDRYTQELFVMRADEIDFDKVAFSMDRERYRLTVTD